MEQVLQVDPSYSKSKNVSCTEENDIRSKDNIGLRAFPSHVQVLHGIPLETASETDDDGSSPEMLEEIYMEMHKKCLILLEINKGLSEQLEAVKNERDGLISSIREIITIPILFFITCLISALTFKIQMNTTT